MIQGQTYWAEVSAVYEAGESERVWAYWIPAIHNPPSNANYELFPDHIHLTWEPPVGSNVDVLEYRIYLDGNLDGTTTELLYDVYDLISGQTYNIALTAYYVDGIESIPIEFEIMFVGADDVLTLETKLLGNYPNPFNPSTTISFNISRKDAKDAELVIYNLKGQKIRKYSIFNIKSSIIWDGKDENGKEVSSGIYLYKLRAHHQTFTRKMLLIK